MTAPSTITPHPPRSMGCQGGACERGVPGASHLSPTPIFPGAGENLKATKAEKERVGYTLLRDVEGQALRVTLHGMNEYGYGIGESHRVTPGNQR